VADEVVACPHCRAVLEVAGRMRGALVNCAQCGRVVEVPGLRDPLWLLARIGALAAAGVAVWAVAEVSTPWLGALAGEALLALAWLVSRAL
jgi:hypothetical protein